MPAPANNQTSQDIKSEYLKKLKSHLGGSAEVEALRSGSTEVEAPSLKFHLGGSAEVEALKSSGSTEVEAPITEKVIITSQNQPKNSKYHLGGSCCAGTSKQSKNLWVLKSEEPNLKKTCVTRPYNPATTLP